MLKKIPIKTVLSPFKCASLLPKVKVSLQNTIVFKASTSFYKYQNDPQIPASLKASDFLV